MAESKIIIDYQSVTIENLKKKKFKRQFDQFALLSLSDHNELVCMLLYSSVAVSYC